MLIRIVRMTFKESEVDNFLQLFEANKHKIRNFEGCHHLELLQDVSKPNVLTTYSQWENEAFLDAYRHSAIFAQVWRETKIKFADKPQAFSLTKLIEVAGENH